MVWGKGGYINRGLEKRMLHRSWPAGKEVTQIVVLRKGGYINRGLGKWMLHRSWFGEKEVT